ncbi:MAG: Bax inhibitor-1/YccA family protein [Oscillospiraceae bacterium]|nr:Bax inhibitor-1/YccA family protein [Oscillospiraceae bacterium]
MERMNMEDGIDIRPNNTLLARTFFWMFLGLLGTGIVAWYTYATGMFETIMTEGFFWGILATQLIVVLLFSFLFMKLPAIVVGIMFFTYAFLTGLTFSSIFYLYELGSIAYIFVGTSGLFGVLGFIGYTTKADLSRWGNILFPALIIGIIMSVVNMFMGNSILQLGLTWVMLIVFCGLVIYDLNKLKNLQNQEGVDQSKLHIHAAMMLYLDFINIFIRLLWLFGKRR